MLLTARRPCPKCKTVCFRDRDCPQMYAAFGFFLKLHVDNAQTFRICGYCHTHFNILE